MSSATHTFDALPYIDSESTPAERAAAQALITSELPQEVAQELLHDTIDYSRIPLHPSLPAAGDFSEHILSLLQGIEDAKSTNKSGKLNVVDLSRYEEVSTPAPNASVEEITAAVERAAISNEYLANRTKSLQALNESGKEEWLAGNAGVQSVLEGLEKELAGTKEAIDRLAHERQSAQEGVKGEVDVLEQSWRGGVERVLRAEVAAEELRAEILERRRMGGGVVN